MSALIDLINIPFFEIILATLTISSTHEALSRSSPLHRTLSLWFYFSSEVLVFILRSMILPAKQCWKGSWVVKLQKLSGWGTCVCSMIICNFENIVGEINCIERTKKLHFLGLLNIFFPPDSRLKEWMFKGCLNPGHSPKLRPISPYSPPYHF